MKPLWTTKKKSCHKEEQRSRAMNGRMGAKGGFYFRVGLV